MSAVVINGCLAVCLGTVEFFLGRLEHISKDIEMRAQLSIQWFETLREGERLRVNRTRVLRIELSTFFTLQVVSLCNRHLRERFRVVQGKEGCCCFQLFL